MKSEFNPKQLSRREALRKGAGAAAGLLACGAWPGALRAQDVATGEFRFVVANDLHYFDEKCIPFFQRVVKQIRATPGGVDFVLLAGDLSDWGQNFHFAAVKDIFGVLKKPVHVVCGNHDWADWDDRKAFLDAYPNSLNYTFEHNGFQVIGLDSTDHNLLRSVNVTPETLAWLDKNLPRLDRKRPLVVFTHFPLHPQLQWPARNSADVLARFREYNLQAVFGGHCHAYRAVEAGPAAVVTNRCCSFKVRNHDRTPEKGYFLCHAKDGKVRREFVAVEA